MNGIWLNSCRKLLRLLGFRGILLLYVKSPENPKKYAFPNSQGLLLSGIFEFQSLAVKGSNGEITGLCGLL